MKVPPSPVPTSMTSTGHKKIIPRSPSSSATLDPKQGGINFVLGQIFTGHHGANGHYCPAKARGLPQFIPFTSDLFLAKHHNHVIENAKLYLYAECILKREDCLLQKAQTSETNGFAFCTPTWNWQ